MYGRYREPVWAFLRRLCRSRSEAEDLFQETWLSAARHAHRLDAASDLRAWLYAIARNKYKNGRRFLVFDLRKRLAFTHECQSESEAPDRSFESKQQVRAVREAMNAMSAPSREIILLSVVEGLDTTAMATVLALREDAVRKRLSRARHELTELVARTERSKATQALRST